jgi:hypothetical protein
MNSANKPKVRIRLSPAFMGSLGAFGYMVQAPEDARRAALAAASAFWGSRYVFRKLVVLYIYNKYRYPDKAATFKSDYTWIQKQRPSNRKTLNAKPAGAIDTWFKCKSQRSWKNVKDCLSTTKRA